MKRLVFCTTCRRHGVRLIDEGDIIICDCGDTPLILKEGSKVIVNGDTILITQPGEEMMKITGGM